MKKKISAVFAVCIMCLLLVVPVFAGDSDGLIVDDAHLLTTEEKAEILEELTEAGSELGMDVVIHTTDGMGGMGITPYADAFVEQFGQGESMSAIGLVVDMDTRDFGISTQGDAIWYFTDYGVQEVLDEVGSYLSEGEYKAAFEQYISVVKSMVAYKDSHGYAWGEDTEENTDTNFDKEKSTQSTGTIVIKIIIAVLIGFGLSFVATKPMKNKMNNVRMKASASDYYNRDELKITGSRDTFLYNTVTKVPRSDNNSSGKGGGGFSVHTSSGGISHGGGSGHF